jgi:hypothetical protein
MASLLSDLVPGLFGLILIFFTVLEISKGEFYGKAGTKVIVEARNPTFFWFMIFVELAGAILLIGVTCYRLSHRSKK